MIRLVDILEEALKEANIVKVPEEILSKLKGIYSYTSKNLDKLKRVAGKSYNLPHIPASYNKYLKFKDLSNNPINVSIGYYNDPKDVAGGRMDTRKDVMLINLAFFGDKEDFLDLGEHELVHAMDPKVRDVKIFGKIYAKKGAEPEGDGVDKYLKSPWEFDAFTAPLINKIKANLDKYGDKKKYTKDILQMFSDLRTKDVEAVAEDEKYSSLAYFFTKRKVTEKDWPKVYAEFYDELKKIKTWITKPTLYKKFLQRLYTTIK